MACFHPNHVISRDGQVRFFGSAAYLKSDDLFYDNAANFHALVPCGRCMGCRLDSARVWADRMLLELRDNDYKAIFVTLTYSNEFLPIAGENRSGYHFLPGEDELTYLEDDERWILGAAGAPSTLSLRDTQLFFKRLRKKFPGRRIRYFLAGEYGPRTKRPHYHAIIYGLTLADFKDCRILDFNNLGQPHYKSKSFQDIWAKGYCVLADVNWNTCAYVSRYTMKKVFKSDNPSEFTDGRIPAFTTMSRRPGIGLLHADELLQHGDKAFVRDVDVTGRESVREIYLGRPFLRSAFRERLKPVFEGSVEPKKAFPEIYKLYTRQKQRAYNSIQRSISNLAVFGGTILEFYQGKELHFLERLKLLPERSDLFGDAQTCQPSKG